MVLVVGSGGREHALIKALKASSDDLRVFVWPGNDGMCVDAERVAVERGQYAELAKWALQNKIELVVIGPEVELVEGLADKLRLHGIRVFGPSQEAAKLEGSKIFAKEFMKEFDIPTARADVVTSVAETLTAAKKYSSPFVLKADGLAAGKGVTISKDEESLHREATDLFENRKLGEAGARALLEEFQPGQELSVLIVTNGVGYEILPICRDHKRLGDRDIGPNTGGMGVVGPIEIDDKLLAQIKTEILDRTIAGLQKRKMLFRGVVFVGIMLTESRPQVLEYNVRFGDPETQVIIPLLDGSWYRALTAISNGDLPKLNWKKNSVACIVLAAEGYPESPIKGVAIQGDLGATKDSWVLHAGTKKQNDSFVTNGGRVLNVVAQAKNLDEALKIAYSRVDKISWPGMQYRKDIGKT